MISIIDQQPAESSVDLVKQVEEIFSPTGILSRAKNFEYRPQQQQMAVAMDNLRGLIPDAVMVRVSTYGTNQEATLAKIDDFICMLIASVAPDIRRLFVG